MRPSRTVSGRTALALVALLVAPALALGGGARLLLAGGADDTVRLRIDARGAARVERDGAVTPIPLPRAAAIDSLVTLHDGWLAAGSAPTPSGRELALWRSTTGGARSVPPPPARHATRDEPLPLVDARGELRALAWLEGDAATRYEVRAATWNGRTWSAPVQVAPRGKGSQLALTGAVLADGSWLLAWSAYDGTADEILWSLHQGSKWSAPRRVDRQNAVPDVTPALRADGKGALLAWSRYDGEGYRLLVARFDGARWQAPHWAADRGTMLPSWEGDALLFRDAAHAAWVGATLSAGDRLTPLVAQVGSPEQRPGLVRDGDRLRFERP